MSSKVRNFFVEAVFGLWPNGGMREAIVPSRCDERRLKMVWMTCQTSAGTVFVDYERQGLDRES